MKIKLVFLIVLSIQLTSCNYNKPKVKDTKIEHSNNELNRKLTPEQKIKFDIDKFGFHVGMIEEDEYLPGFAYTIGLYKTYNHPEIIIFGLKNELLSGILKNLGDEIKNGKQYTINKDYQNIISNFPVRFIEVKKAHYKDYLGYAGWFYNSFDFPVYQLIWTDKENNYPWDKRFNANWKFKQPILDRNADFKFYEERNLGVFTTQFTFEGNPILWVYHNEDGDWQFHSEEDPKIVDSKVVSLESLVKLDSTLNEIYYLNYGQFAIRKSIDAEWEVLNSK